MPDEVTIHEARTQFSRLVQRAHAGEETVPRTPGRLRGQIEIAADFEDRGEKLGDLLGLPRP